MARIRFAALDGSLRNFGCAKLEYDTETNELGLLGLHLIKTEKSKVKTVRASSDNLARAQLIAAPLADYIKDCSVAFVEVPSGGQDYASVYAFGIVVGLYASIAIPVIEVSPAETKLAAVGTRTASKQEMIEWAVEKYPLGPWRTVKRQGVMVPTNDNEHLADAVAIAYAGIKTTQFRTMKTMFQLASK